MGIGDWGSGIENWGFGQSPNPQSPIHNPQSPHTDKFKEINKLNHNYLKNN